VINKWALQSEKLFHGHPSGIDNTICTFGGALLFKEKQIKSLNDKIQLKNFLLVNTRVKRNTRALIDEAIRRRDLVYLLVNTLLLSLTINLKTFIFTASGCL